LAENTFLKFNCGEYSYAEIPKSFVYILGVTGTLEALIPEERKYAIEG
jgi:hypothetical protein